MTLAPFSRSHKVLGLSVLYFLKRLLDPKGQVGGQYLFLSETNVLICSNFEGINLLPMLFRINMVSIMDVYLKKINF